METEAFDYLDAPVERITGLDIPMPYAITLESLCTPITENVINAIRRVLK